jgi:hypothetical protein
MSFANLESVVSCQQVCLFAGVSVILLRVTPMNAVFGSLPSLVSFDDQRRVVFVYNIEYGNSCR